MPREHIYSDDHPPISILPIGIAVSISIDASEIDVRARFGKGAKFSLRSYVRSTLLACKKAHLYDLPFQDLK